VINAKVRELARAGAAARGHVLNLGHGCLPDTPVEGVRAFIEGEVLGRRERVRP
jgi:uroporphyrinogen-III decarboxylase